MDFLHRSQHCMSDFEGVKYPANYIDPNRLQTVNLLKLFQCQIENLHIGQGFLLEQVSHLARRGPLKLCYRPERKMKTYSIINDIFQGHGFANEL